MRIAEGTRLGPYEVTGFIGAGGMGEVYKGRDTRLDRVVAIKILPSEFAADPMHKARFEREARTISQLNHPSICTLHDVGELDGAHYLVMEFIEGDSLADRLARGALPIELVLKYGMQVAEALDRAHRQGIIHRDLKPGNVMISKGGAKLLDFGLAKPDGRTQGSGASLIDGPTEQKPLTQEGTILGTFQYMAPEQLEGLEADARTDIWALGALLYEMATGKRAFEGKTKTSLIAAIVDRDPIPVSSVQPLTPPALEHVIRKCLSKDPDDRWQSAHDIAEELRWTAEAGSQAGVSAEFIKRRRSRRALRIAAAGLLLAAVVVSGVLLLRGRADHATTETRFTIGLADAVELDINGSAFAVSPDGTMVAYVAGPRGGKPTLWLRRFEKFEAEQIRDSERATKPFWSPDSQWIAFFSEGKLRKVRVSGGTPEAVCDARYGVGGAWSRDDVIVFSPAFGEALYRVPASGGQPSSLTTLDAKARESVHAWPQFFPDGKHFVFLARAAAGVDSVIRIGSLDATTTDILTPADALVGVHPDGYIFFVRETRLLAQKIDFGERTVAGQPFTVIDRVGYSSDWGAVTVSISAGGTLVYSPTIQRRVQLRQFDRSGKELGIVGKPAYWAGPTFNAAGDRVAAARLDDKTGGYDVWVVGLDREIETRLTTHPSSDSGPVWSPDGERIVFLSERRGLYDLFEKPSGGGGADTLLFENGFDKTPGDWSPDGRSLVYWSDESGTREDLWLLDMETKKPQRLIATEFSDSGARFSPDGRYLAWNSDESGRYEIYAAPLDALEKRVQVSSAGAGGAPRWTRGGREIVYLDEDETLQSVELNAVAGASLRVSPPRPLFKLPSSNGIDVSGDGERVIIAATIMDEPPPTIHVILGWSPKVPDSGMK